MDVTESCAGPLPMYNEVKSDLSTLLQLFQAQAHSPFVALLQTVLLVVEFRLWLCQWYLLLHDPDARSGLAAVATDGPEAQAARQDPLSALTTRIQRLHKEQSSTFLLPWKEVVLAEGKMVTSSLQTLTLLNRYPSDLLSVVVELLRLRKALQQWEDDAAKQPPASARGVIAGAPRRQILRQQFQHLVNKMPLRFHGVADQVMPLTQYNTELLGLASSSTSLSARHSNPYIGLIAQFLLSYGPTALVCVASFMQSQADEEGEKEEVAEGLAYALPRATGSPTAPSQRQDIVSREFVPIFSMTSGQAAAASSSKQHSSSSARRPTSSFSTESPMGRPSSTASTSSSSNVSGIATTAAGLERGGPSTTSFSSSSLPVRRDHGPPAWFWELCHHSGLWPAVEGRLPEGGAQRFSLLGAGGGGGVSGRKLSPLEGTFVHQSGRHHIFTYFVAHISPQERLVVAFGDRNRPAMDRVVLSFLIAATSILNDSMAFGV